MWQLLCQIWWDRGNTRWKQRHYFTNFNNKINMAPSAGPALSDSEPQVHLPKCLSKTPGWFVFSWQAGRSCRSSKLPIVKSVVLALDTLNRTQEQICTVWFVTRFIELQPTNSKSLPFLLIISHLLLLNEPVQFVNGKTKSKFRGKFDIGLRESSITTLLGTSD